MRRRSEEGGRSLGRPHLIFVSFILGVQELFAHFLAEDGDGVVQLEHRRYSTRMQRGADLLDLLQEEKRNKYLDVEVVQDGHQFLLLVGNKLP